MAAGGKIIRVWNNGKTVKFEGEDGRTLTLCTAVSIARAEEIVDAFEKSSKKMVIKAMRAARRERRKLTKAPSDVG